METLRADDPDSIPRAMATLDAGELVVVPGDLRYVVVTDALDDDAIERLFAATGRSADRPLTVLVSGYTDLHHVAYGGPGVRDRVDALWPGPTVLSARARPWVPAGVTAGRDVLRVNAPKQPFTNALARQFGPLAAAGARVQGQPDALDARAAGDRLGAHAPLCIDGGALPGGEEPHVLAEQG